ncbi:hypothetical protein U9M48_026358 [Paspalum notatum var. saurae]|uniref:Uncharacterized protein n=1 Tax=Paspalum notatum var. saurae TaxID=547442 RepID=A0AAQ3WY88_PASNO
MSVVAAVGPGAAAYGQLCGGGGGGGGARKRKDHVVQDQEAEALVGARGDDGCAAEAHAAGLFVLETVEEEAADEERSSIGAVSEDEDEDGEEVDSRREGGRGAAAAGALACMDALDDALPIKRGLSNFFSGKSRSFANLQDAASAVSSARGLAKPENPFNKRRRVLRCCSIRRVASTSLTTLPHFLPPAAADSAGNDDTDGDRAGSG